MQLPLGSRWTDTQGQEFVIDSVNCNEAETWVSYHRLDDHTHYNCLAEAFTHRFKRTENEPRT